MCSYARPNPERLVRVARRQMIAKTSSTEPRATRASEATRTNANTPGAVNASCAAPSSWARTLSPVSCAAGRASLPPFADPTVSSIIIAVLLHSPLRGPIALPPILAWFISDPFRQRGNASRYLLQPVVGDGQHLAFSARPKRDPLNSHLTLLRHLNPSRCRHLLPPCAPLT